MVWRARRARGERFVVAARTDGLGERLNTLLNAIRLADLLSVDFRFSWPLRPAEDAKQAIVPAADFFSADFIAVHMIEHDTTGYVRPAGRAEDLEALRDQLTAAERGLVAPNRRLGTFVDDRAVPGVSGGFSAEFARIGFHPRIEAAVEAARAVPLVEGAAGLHLRAGDVLHEPLVIWNRNTPKVVPAPVARALTERLRAEGRDVLLFGQDQELIDELCHSTGAIDGGSLRPPGDPTQPEEAMFDIALLSRCEPIIGGNSGFVRQAAIIADKSVSDFRKLVPAPEIVAMTRADIAQHGDRYSTTQRAFAWWAAYYAGRADLEASEAIELVENAVATDPTNPHFRLRLAALCHRDGQHERGDAVLTDSLAFDAASGSPTLPSVMMFSRSGGGLLTMAAGSRLRDSAEILDDFERAADLGSGPAAIYRAALRADRGDAIGAAADLEAFRVYAASAPGLADIDELDKLARATIAERTKLFDERSR